MEQNPRKYIVASYEMYDITDGKNILIEATPEDKPMTVITGINMIPLTQLEDKLATLAKGDDFELGLTRETAFGEHDPEAVIELPKEYLSVNGRFPSDIVMPGTIIPLQNEAGEVTGATVIEVCENHVRLDCNHPLAGKDLLIRGQVIESHPATDEEVMALTMPHHCGGCGGGCHGGSCGDGGCGGCGSCGEEDNECENNCCGGGCGHCAS